MKKERTDSDRNVQRKVYRTFIEGYLILHNQTRALTDRFQFAAKRENERGDVPGWVLVVLMTTGLVTAIWTIAAPRLTAILRNSLDSMNGIR